MSAHVCDVCSLPDPYNGEGDGIGSCACPRGDCGAPDWSVFCTCPTEDDGPACWDQAPGGGARCGLDVDHEGDHSYTIWNPLEVTDPATTPRGPESDSEDVQASRHQNHPAKRPTTPHRAAQRHP